MIGTTRKVGLLNQIVMQGEFVTTRNGLLNAGIKPHFPHRIPDLQVGEGFIRAHVRVRLV